MHRRTYGVISLRNFIGLLNRDTDMFLFAITGTYFSNEGFILNMLKVERMRMMLVLALTLNTRMFSNNCPCSINW